MTAAGVATNATPCLALDIGGTKVDAAVVWSDGRMENRERILVADQTDLLSATVALLKRVRADFPIDVLGVGTAGPMTKGGELISPLNIASWRNFPLRERLRTALDLEVFVEIDAKALALAEGRFGGAQDDDSYMSLVVSTGIGGAIVMNGRLLDGATGNAGHIGHLNVVPNGRLCSCGSYGCLEAEASGWAITDMTGAIPALANQTTRERCAEMVGRAIGSLASVLDVSRCYVAGSVALGFGDVFFDVATKTARSLASMPYCADLEIRQSALDQDGPLLGAACVAWRGAL
jgi:glucokinase